MGAGSPGELVEGVRACGLSCVQLALDPIRRNEWDEREAAGVLGEAGIAIISGMMATKGEDYSSLESIRRTGGVRPDSTWSENLAAAKLNASLAMRLGMKLVTFHAGFLPHEIGSAERRRMVERLRVIADVFGDAGVSVALETGQESAETLTWVLSDVDRANVGVNFDPANMILYGMGDPVAALEMLSGAVRQIHIKDATATTTPGEWGMEVVAGRGDVHWESLAGVILGRELDVDLVIEREAGETRVEDIREAAMLVRRLGLG